MTQRKFLEDILLLPKPMCLSHTEAHVPSSMIFFRARGQHLLQLDSKKASSFSISKQKRIVVERAGISFKRNGKAFQRDEESNSLLVVGDKSALLLDFETLKTKAEIFPVNPTLSSHSYKDENGRWRGESIYEINAFALAPRRNNIKVAVFFDRV